ncbi:TPR-like protein [Chloropicon primus]|uniref:TPR-like protein n=1 Tax=Chloropicon primus TaxID=1764295 RepID=A0A5B8MKE0_9CHLO|nr:TPR-like protein [Chloropicon primus]|mmetsp:Transcript_1393/g.3994  ORF Transcript_1393/g.3994 Transcript_1393/m.3994 type:complete len:269 (+) Transcript_1393:23-829(+)|eukprot:QDZ19850.1 TPR-like protein [Chloropicon primus]
MASPSSKSAVTGRSRGRALPRCGLARTEAATRGRPLEAAKASPRRRRESSHAVLLGGKKPRGDVDRRRVRRNALEVTENEIGELAGILSSVDASSSIQLVYVGALLGLLSGAVFLVVRQVLFRTQLEEATKDLSEKARTGDATYDEYYELGVLLIRKKLFATALKHLDSAKRQWEGDEEGLAQLYNAMGYAYLQQDKLESAIEEYKGAIDLRPNYLVAWNNLGDAYKKTKDYENSLEAYNMSIKIDPSNKVAQEQVTFLKDRVSRLTK